MQFDDLAKVVARRILEYLKAVSEVRDVYVARVVVLVAQINFVLVRLMDVRLGVDALILWISAESMLSAENVYADCRVIAMYLIILMLST